MRKFMGKKMGKKGFTLIELIVVIAVIGILVLLAAPKFLGYTRDAHTAAMKADAKVLSNAALVYYIDGEVKENGEEWPVGDAATAEDMFEVINADGETVEVTGTKIDPEKLDKNYIKNLKNPMDDYVLVTGEEVPEITGDVFYVPGTTDRVGNVWHGVDVTAETRK